MEFSKKEDTINLDQDVITIVISTDREKSHKKLKVFQFEFAKQDVISPAVEMTMLKNKPQSKALGLNSNQNVIIRAKF